MSGDNKTMTTLFRDDYQDKFSPLRYLKDRYETLEEGWISFNLHYGYTFLRNEAISGSRLLDLGCGPNLINVIAAPDHYTHIVMADYTEANLDFVRRWSRGDDVGFDWDHVCMYYSQKYKLSRTWRETRLATLKSYIKDVVQCDVQQSEPLGRTYTGFFDCVFSSYCLETASRDIEGYSQSVKNVSTLLRDGGHLVMRGSVGETDYTVDGKNFNTLFLTVPQLKTALKMAGFKLIDLNVEGDVDHTQITKSTAFCLLAQKIGRKDGNA